MEVPPQISRSCTSVCTASLKQALIAGQEHLLRHGLRTRSVRGSGAPEPDHSWVDIYGREHPSRVEGDLVDSGEVLNASL